MKKIVLLLSILIGSLFFQSCGSLSSSSPTYVSAIYYFNEKYIGKTKSYIIEDFPYTITEVRRISSDYEVLVFERARNYYIGDAYTYFHMKNERCYRIETNEYMLVE